MLPFELVHVDFEHSDEVDNSGIAPFREPAHNCFRYTIATRTPPRPVRIHGILLCGTLSRPRPSEQVCKGDPGNLITWITTESDVIDQICAIPGSPVGNARDAQGVVHRLEKIGDSARIALVATLLDSERTTIWLAASKFNPLDPSLIFLTSHESAKAALCDPEPPKGIELMKLDLQVWPYPRGDFARLASD